jgi:hypothetical protein
MMKYTGNVLKVNEMRSAERSIGAVQGFLGGLATRRVIQGLTLRLQLVKKINHKDSSIRYKLICQIRTVFD